MNEDQAKAVAAHLRAESEADDVDLPIFMDDYFMRHLLPIASRDELKTWLTSMGGTPTQVAAALKVADDLGEEDVVERSTSD